VLARRTDQILDSKIIREGTPSLTHRFWSLLRETRYLAFFEAFLEHLGRSGTAKSFSRLSFPRLYRDYLFREGIRRRSFDDISRMNGWAFHIDGIHLDSRGGAILVDVVQQFLDSQAIFTAVRAHSAKPRGWE
jgi:hypothetical protein